MSNNNFYRIIFFIGFAGYLITAFVLGVNNKSAIEDVLKTLSFGLMFWGIFGDVSTNLTVQKHYHCKDVVINQEEATNNITYKGKLNE